MEIQALTLTLTDQDLNDLAARHLPDDLPVEDLRFRLSREGLDISGEYPLFLRVSFETHWELAIRAGQVTARLAHVKTFGLPVPMAKGMLFGILRETLAKKDWLELDGDNTVMLNVDRWLEHEGVPLRTNLTGIQCLDGSMLVNALAKGSP
jgi:hypothetical protein